MRKLGIGYAALYGALAGVMAANCMTVVRMAARRHKHIEKTVPQAMEEWLSGKTGIEPPGGAAGHHVVDQALHAGYGAALGALYGAVLGERERATLSRGLGYGVATFILGRFVLIPLVGSARPAWRADTAENVVDFAAHAVYGLATALLTEELVRQSERGPRRIWQRFATRVG